MNVPFVGLSQLGEITVSDRNQNDPFGSVMRPIAIGMKEPIWVPCACIGVNFQNEMVQMQLLVQIFAAYGGLARRAAGHLAESP